MNTAQTHDTKPTFLEQLSNFISRHRVILIGFLVVLAVAVIALFVVMQVSTSRTEKSLVLIEDLQSSYGEWLALEPEARSSEFAPLVEEIAQVAETYPKSYAAQRAAYIHARALTELERWAEASTHYLEVADRFPEVYLAPISLTQAAVASENAGEPEIALEILQRLVDQYEAESGEIPRALFSIGRISEGLNQIPEAAKSYNRLIDEYPASSWTNLARDRIITLSVQGRIGS